MASEYLKKLAREQKIEQVKHEMTPKEKRQNWWYYHKVHVLIGVAVVIVLALMINDLVFNRDPEPDYQLAYIGQSYMPADTKAALEEALAELGTDLNEDGQVAVRINEYPLYAADVNYQTAMAAQVQMSVDVDNAESFIFLMEDPAQFQYDFELLAYPDGTQPGESDLTSGDIWYAWTDCPVLAGLDLGMYELDDAGGTVTGDGQEVMAGLSVARRWVSEEEVATREGVIAFWDKLTQGAE